MMARNDANQRKTNSSMCLAWAVSIHLPGGLPMGSAKDLDTAKAEFKAAWEALKARTTPLQRSAGVVVQPIAGCPSQTSPNRAGT